MKTLGRAMVMAAVALVALAFAAPAGAQEEEQNLRSLPAGGNEYCDFVDDNIGQASGTPFEEPANAYSENIHPDACGSGDDGDSDNEDSENDDETDESDQETDAGDSDTSGSGDDNATSSGAAGDGDSAVSSAAAEADTAPVLPRTGAGGVLMPVALGLLGLARGARRLLVS